MNDPAGSIRFESCYARYTGRELVVGNSLVERSWAVGEDGLLRATSLRFVPDDVQWIVEDPLQPATPGVACAGGPVRVDLRVDRSHPVERPSLVVTISNGAVVQTVQIFPDSSGVLTRLDVVSPLNHKTVGGANEWKQEVTTGVEIDSPMPTQASAVKSDVIETIKIDPLNHTLTAVRLVDQTDGHNNLVFEQTWQLHPSERTIEARGNLFYLENKLTGLGLIFVKLAPGPDARPIKTDIDLSLRDSDLLILGHGASADDGQGYPHAVIPYAGGKAGRVVALQTFQRQLRPYVPGRDGLFLSNTWGDRSRDARVNATFINGEINAAETLGVDVLQIDDGWQKGTSANSANSAGGVWTGFWAADANFWDTHPERLPEGLTGLIERARTKQIRFGLWFAPDSSGDMANWRRDADAVLRFYREWGVDYVKLDAVKMHSKTNERNLAKFYDAVLRESAGRVTFDHDVTAEVRPGYLGATHSGNIFVENRYTDWHSYWPHATLRNLWQLAHHIDPVRLRMEFLNTSRNVEKYANDPLAPNSYDPAYLFASVMFACPLGWFEIQNLPEAFAEKVSALVRVWKAHRDMMYEGRIIPIGDAPDGTQWTGFLSVGRNGQDGYLLAIREMNGADEHYFDLPLISTSVSRADVLAGSGTVDVNSSGASVRTERPKQFVFARLS